MPPRVNNHQAQEDLAALAAQSGELMEADAEMVVEDVAEGLESDGGAFHLADEIQFPPDPTEVLAGPSWDSDVFHELSDSGSDSDVEMEDEELLRDWGAPWSADHNLTTSDALRGEFEAQAAHLRKFFLLSE